MHLGARADVIKANRTAVDTDRFSFLTSVNEVIQSTAELLRPQPTEASSPRSETSRPIKHIHTLKY